MCLYGFRNFHATLFAMTALKSPHPDDVLTLLHPDDETAAPLLMDSPHSGRVYPEDFETVCPHDILQASEDRFVDLLMRDGVLHGATVLLAEFPRTYIDVNRAASDIETIVLADPRSYPHPRDPSEKAENGIGLIRRLARRNVPMYDHPLPGADILHRIDHYYRPYHQALETEISRLKNRFGKVLYLDIHSMPHELAPPVRQSGLMQFINPRRADFVIGDRDGTTCDIGIRNAIRQFIENAGYTAELNKPFKGWELIRRHADSAGAVHALQIEINRSLYLHKGDSEWKDDGGLELKNFFERLTKHCVDILH